jgi:predicted PurR-regulated permease PerM
VVLVLALVALWALHPLWAPILLAAWTAILAQPLHRRLMKMGGRSRAAGTLTVAFVVIASAPLVLIGLSLFGTAVDLAHKLQQAPGGKDALGILLSTEPSSGFDRTDLQRTIELARQHGASAFRTVSTIFGAATEIVIGLFVFLYGFYTFLVDGARAKAWLIGHLPLPERHAQRFGAAFVETGRGLFIGVGMTALVQGSLATLGYVIIGVPQALVLGLLTTLAAFIPSVGTGLVWVPVTVALFMSGRNGAGIALLCVGCVISVTDNFIRPWLSRYGHLKLPAFVLFVAMLGGIAAFGAWGVLLGPLTVRLAVEGLAIWREERERAREQRDLTHLESERVARKPVSTRSG